MEVEYKIELTNIPEVFIQNLHETLHELQYNQLILIFIHNGYEVETSVSLVDDLVLLVVQEIAHLGITGDY